MTNTPLSVENISQIADLYFDSFPDLRDTARSWARHLLKFHTKLDLNPDLVYWHDFDNAQSSARAHTGWQHIGKALDTVTVTDLVLARFRTFYQVNFDLLDQMSGFYTVKEAGLYNESNEVPLAPSEIMKDFWATDFTTHYEHRLELFLRDYAEDGRVLVKILFYSFAFNAYNHGAVSHRQLQVVFNAFAGPTNSPPTLEDMKATHTERRIATVHTFTLGDLTSYDILRIQTTDGAQILYMPASWFRTFHNEQQMYQWVAEAAAAEHSRERLLSHFDTPGESTEPPRALLLRTLESIRRTPWKPGQRLLNGGSVEIKTDVFSFLFDTVRTRLKLDAHELLTSNHELRKELFLVDLEGFMRIVTPLAPADPAVAAVAVAGGSLSFGAHLAKAVHGRTKAKRKAAFRAAVVDALDIVLSMLLLRGADGLIDGSVQELSMESAPTDVELEKIDLAEPDNPHLDLLAVDEDLSETVEGTGVNQGVHARADGTRYIRMDGKVFQVRYIEDLKRWVIVDPMMPEQFTGSWPVQRTAKGRWELFSVPVPAADMPGADSLGLFDTSAAFRDIIQMLVEPKAGQLMTGPIDSVMLDARAELVRLRTELGRQAQALFVTPLTQTTPPLPALNSLMTPKQFLTQTLALNQGLVVNEAAGGLGSCELLIKQMPTLKALQVKTIYVEGLLHDLHQPLIAEYMKTGRFPRALERRLQQLHARSPQLDDGHYTPRQVLVEARRQGLDIQALDCAASLSTDGMQSPAADLSHRMRVFYGFKRIKAAQNDRPQDKWVALTDQTLANHYSHTPGLANLLGMPSLRVSVVGRDMPTRLALDAGEVIKPGLVPIKGDVSLKLPAS